MTDLLGVWAAEWRFFRRWWWAEMLIIAALSATFYLVRAGRR